MFIFIKILKKIIVLKLMVCGWGLLLLLVVFVWFIGRRWILILNNFVLIFDNDFFVFECFLLVLIVYFYDIFK